MSDSGPETEKALLLSGVDLRSDIVVKGQHPHGGSGSIGFLDAAQPRLIVATSKDFPEHERIPDEWADMVRARGIKLFRQDETGAVQLRFWQGWLGGASPCQRRNLSKLQSINLDAGRGKSPLESGMR